MRNLSVVLLLLLFFSASGQQQQRPPTELPELVSVNELIKTGNYTAAAAALDQLILKNRSALNQSASAKSSSDARSATQLLLAKTFQTYGTLNLMQQKFDEALKLYYSGLDNLDSLRYPLETGRIYSNIGTLYSIMKNLPKGKEYFLKSLAINKTGNQDRLKTLSNLAGIYAESGADLLAVQTFNNAIGLAVKLNDVPMEAVLQTNLGNYYLKKKSWEKAIASSRKSLALRKNLQQPVSVITLNNLGYALAQTGQYKQAVDCYLQALPAANAQEKKQLYYNLYQVSKTSKNSTAALENMERYSHINDSLSKLGYENKVASLTAAYEAVKKQQTINSLQKRTEVQESQLREQKYLILAGILILLLSAVVIFMRVKNYNVKEALEKSQIKRQLLLLQLNPHFIFNALQSVQQFIYNREQQPAMEYLNSFSRLIRLVLENSDRDMITLDEEIEILTHYLHLQQLGQDSSFTYHIEVGSEIETETMEIPVMLLQPFVENAVVHGVKDKKDGRILIRIACVNDTLQIWIQDNGHAEIKDSNEAENSLHRSMGMTILQQRITELNKDGHRKISLSVDHHNEADQDYPGTIVHFQFSL